MHTEFALGESEVRERAAVVCEVVAFVSLTYPDYIYLKYSITYYNLPSMAHIIFANNSTAIIVLFGTYQVFTNMHAYYVYADECGAR